MKQTDSCPLWMLVGGPRAIPLMVEQSGERYVTVFTCESNLNRFQIMCCSRDQNQPLQLNSTSEILDELRKAQKRGCKFILIDPSSSNIAAHEAKVLADFVQIFESKSSSKAHAK